MIPSWRIWKGLDPVQKATYVAQVATTLSFLAASVFSYLSWQEAARSRQDQRDFFISEKAPDITVETFGVATQPSSNMSYALVVLKNRGLSPAKDVQVSIFGKEGKFVLTSENQVDEFYGGSSYIAKDKEILFGLFSNDVAKKLCNCESFVDVQIDRYAADVPQDKKHFLLQVTYFDLLGNKHQEIVIAYTN